MSLFERMPLPKRLSSRMWLVTLPTALVSFERRQNVPRLPIGAGRFAGVPLIAGGLALAVWAWRRSEASLPAGGPMTHIATKPATLGGVLVVGGAGLLLRSSFLIAYALGIALAAATDAIAVEEPTPAHFLGRGNE